jgi:hypothetical protein
MTYRPRKTMAATARLLQLARTLWNAAIPVEAGKPDNTTLLGWLTQYPDHDITCAMVRTGVKMHKNLRQGITLHVNDGVKYCASVLAKMKNVADATVPAPEHGKESPCTIVSSQL